MSFKICVIGCGEQMYETNGFYYENYAFFENVRNGIKNIDTIASCTQVVEIAECIKKRILEYHK